MTGKHETFLGCYGSKQSEPSRRHIKRFVPGSVSKCISQFSQALSPHLAAQLDGNSSVGTKTARMVLLHLCSQSPDTNDGCIAHRTNQRSSFQAQSIRRKICRSRNRWWGPFPRTLWLSSSRLVQATETSHVARWRQQARRHWNHHIRL